MLFCCFLLFFVVLYVFQLAVFFEKLFDKIFVVLSVLLRDTKTTISGANFTEKLLRHGLTLLPAFRFAMHPNPYKKLVERYQLHTTLASHAGQNNASFSSRMATISSHSHRLSTTSTMSTTSTKSNELTSSNLPRKPTHKSTMSTMSNISFNRNRKKRKSLILMEKNNVVMYWVIKAAALISCSLGLFVLVMISLRYHNITQFCEQEIGAIAHCAIPRFYFSDGLLFGQVRCGETMYLSFNCSGKLSGVKQLKENAGMYSRMTNVTSIDISMNNDLQSVPDSFASIPSLQFLNISVSATISLKDRGQM